MKKLILTLLFALTVLCATSSYGQIPINGNNIVSFPYVISAPGSYKLTTNINSGTATAFEITANNVTFDLGGYSVNGILNCTSSACSYSNGQYTGISATGRNITIQNGSVSGYYTNVFLEENGIIQNIISTSGIFGIYSDDATVRNCNVANNTIGIDSGYGTIEDNTLYWNWQYNLIATSSAVLHNTITYDATSGMEGIVMYGGVVGSNSITAPWGSGGTDLVLTDNAISQKNNACTAGLC
jgi:hypothetical protein